MDFMCSNCNSYLDIQSINESDIKFFPCEKCMEDSFNEGKNEGYDEGYDEGYEIGIDKD
jgi:flagellar biosynthesis/type III secretory pathway protein FliH